MIIDDLRSTFFSLYYKSADVVFTQIFEELERLAKDLSKDVPSVSMDLPKFGLTIEGIEILQNVFVHLLRIPWITVSKLVKNDWREVNLR